MADEIVLDLGEYGEILVESGEELAKGGLMPVTRGEEESRRRKIDAGALLRAPLTGLGKLFMATLPESKPGDPYELDEFCVQFELGIEAEAGSALGVVAKITPNGTMTCTYTWKRKKTEKKTASE
ncbi:MAG: hypothetical protein RBT47_03140 [Anaerolineae bacterium]|jgi:hypothetical protein|nr:hypothetical protein [Anaerolineae bacterium]